MMFFILYFLIVSSHAATVPPIRADTDLKDLYNAFKKRATPEDNESLQEFIHENPLLSQLPMFSKRQPEDDRYSRHSSIKIFDKVKKSSYAQYAENNFSDEYDFLNRTLFDLAEDKNVPDIRSPPQMFVEESNSNEEATTEEPFAVTGNLVDALESAALSKSGPISQKSPSFLNSAYYGLTSTKPSIPPPTTQIAITSSQQIQSTRKMGLAESQFLGQNFMQLHPFKMNRPISVRIDENEVKRSHTKGYLEVWGTKYYEDNRIDGDIQLRSDTVGGVSQRNPFAIEAEMMQGKNNFDQSNPSNVAFGVKTLTDVVHPPTFTSQPDDTKITSETKMLKNDGKPVEERVSHMKNQKITVRLSNPLLFGHDYLMYPGAIIQPKVLTYKETVKTLNKRKKNKARAFGSLVSNPYEGSDAPTSRSRTLQLFPTTPLSNVSFLKGVCGLGTAPLFVRSSDVEETVGSGRTVVIQSNEDDCVSSCLTNKVDDRLPFDCVSASYRKDTRDCQLTSGISRHLLRPHVGSVYYEKTCVDATVAEACSGATVVRKEQTVLVGFLRDSFATESIEECIALCISSETSAGYRCLSFVYYYEESLNCILSEASEITAPRAVIKESTTDVDYFGVDECYGIAYASDDKTVASTKIQNAHYVEDDIRVGEITAGSMVHPLRKFRNH